MFNVDLKYVTKKAPKVKPLLDFLAIQAFDKKTNSIFAFSFLATIFSWHFLNCINQTIKNEQNRTGLIKLFLIAISIQTSVSAPVRGLKSLHHRIFLGVQLISALVLCNAFQGLIVSNLTQRIKSTDINTLDQLIKSRLNLTAMVLLPNLFKPNKDESNVNEIQKKLYHIQKLNFDPGNFIKLDALMLVDGNGAFLSKLNHKTISEI